MQDKDRLRSTRLDFKNQMVRAIKCRTKAQKIKLAKEWEQKYSPLQYKELIACARNEQIRMKIANWEL